MVWRAKVVTESEAQTLRDIHRQLWEAMEGKKDYSGVYGTLVTLANLVPRFQKFIGPIANVSAIADLLWGVSQRSNSAANISAIRGAEKQFEQVRYAIASGGHRRAEFQMNWITFPSVSTTHEFVQGNNSNPGRGYKILRMQLSNGSWVSYTN
ncbi:hypothetical protein [Ornithinibacillus sp. FSL M8-0202]|uniref:hypothetical protein n=1 Tax=Ornithinibacillus sp. FSL M8-0202 TaxID=2921616 RepID=UPI0030D5CAA2